MRSRELGKVEVDVCMCREGEGEREKGERAGARKGLPFFLL